MKSSQQAQVPESEPSDSHGAQPVEELLEQRARITGWLERLEDAPAANPRAVERVRADYRQRLDEVMTRLGGHRDALREQRRTLAATLAEAEEAEQTARDALDEAELRYRIGEIREEEWEGKRQPLERAVGDAGSAAREARDEAARLEEVLDAIEGGIDTVPSPGPFDDPRVPAHAPPAHAAGAPIEEAVHDPPFPIATEAGSDAPADGQQAGPTGEDAEPAATGDAEGAGPEFLEELDRAIEASADTRPRPGAKCPDCGYTNDFDAWYCGVCGVDLA